MALLLAMYQKFKLTREKNNLSYKLARHSSKLSRLQDNISKKQKYYEGLLKKASQKATNFKNMFKLQLQNSCGLGTSVFNPSQFNAFNNQAVGMLLMKGLKEGVEYKDNNDTSQIWKPADADKAYRIVMQFGANAPQAVGADKKPIEGYVGTADCNISTDDYNKALSIYTQATMYQQQQQQYVAAATQQYETNVSIWQEALEAQITAEQDSVLEAMEYEESMMELDKLNMETKLERIKAELESYTSLLSEEAKNTAPKFGL